MEKKQVKKNTTFYYLRINYEDLVDFSGIYDLFNMDDYLKLNLFTGCFNNQEELVEALKRIGLIQPDTQVVSLDIVRRIGNKKDGYEFKYMTNNITFSQDVPFLSVSTLKNFMQRNRNNPEIIDSIVEYYRDRLEKKVYYKNRDAMELKSRIDLLPKGEEKKQLLEKYQSELNSLKHFTSELSILRNIQEHAGKLDRGEFISNDEIIEYIANIDRFIENETFYFKGDKKSPNNLGLVKMARKFSQIMRQNKNAVSPEFTKKFNPVLSEFRKFLAGIPVRQTLVRTPSSGHLIENEDGDPDEYMFLEDSDFEPLRRNVQSETSQESIDVDIENLHELQKSTPKL